MLSNLLALSLFTSSLSISQTASSTLTSFGENLISIDDDTDHEWCKSDIYCDGPVLKNISLADLYTDGKTFIDKPTLKPSQEVIKNFDSLPNYNNETINKFIDQNFGKEGQEILTINLDETFIKSQPEFLNSINNDIIKGFSHNVHLKWNELLRQVNTSVVCNGTDCESTLLEHPNPFVVPGGRFRELYYWDSYFTLKGMLISGLKEEVKNNLRNFIYSINTYGFIPNGFRSYYLNRSQPPLFTLMIDDYIKYTNDTQFLKNEAIDAIVKELEWWESNKFINVSSPNTLHKVHNVARYNVENYSPRPESYLADYETATSLNYTEDEMKKIYSQISTAAETGWDFSTRWSTVKNSTDSDEILRNLKTKSIIPVDLNSIIYKSYKALSNYYNHFNDEKNSEKYLNKAQNLKDAIIDLNWNGDENHLLFYDYDFENQKSSEFWSPASYFPFWAGIIPNEVINDEHSAQLSFLGLRYVVENFNGSIPTSLIESGQQWDYPNAWAPLQSIIIESLNSLPSNITTQKLLNVNKDENLFSLVPKLQFGLNENDIPIQPSKSNQMFDYITNVNQHSWKDVLVNEISQKWLTTTFCSWYSSGGSIENLLNKSDNANNDDNGYMFEKYDVRDVNAAGGQGGEYEVAKGFGWSNGVLIDIINKFNNELITPTCPGIQLNIKNNNTKRHIIKKDE